MLCFCLPDFRTVRYDRDSKRKAVSVYEQTSSKKSDKFHNSGVDRSVDYIFGLRLSKRDFYKQGSVGTVYPAEQLLGTASVYCDSDCAGCHSGDSGRTDLSGRSRLFRTLVWIFIQRCRDYHWFLH